MLRWLRRASQPPRPAGGYREHWNVFAQQDAMTAILTPREGSVDRNTFDNTGRKEAEAFSRFVTPESTVLDIGCGIGRIEKHLAQYCRRIYSVDVSDEMIARARQWCAGRDNVHFVVASAAQVDCFRPDSFDFVFSYLVLQHLECEDAFLALRSIARMVKPDGRVFVQFPLLGSQFYTDCFLRQAVNRDRQPYRVRTYTLEQVEHYCQHAGLAIERIGVGLDGLVSEAEIGVIARRA